MDDLNVGDVVILKSGGPRMIIEVIGDYTMTKGINNGAYCKWFDGSKVIEEVFDVRSLKKVEE